MYPPDQLVTDPAYAYSCSINPRPRIFPSLSNAIEIPSCPTRVTQTVAKVPPYRYIPAIVTRVLLQPKWGLHQLLTAVVRKSPPCNEQLPHLGCFRLYLQLLQIIIINKVQIDQTKTSTPTTSWCSLIPSLVSLVQKLLQVNLFVH